VQSTGLQKDVRGPGPGGVQVTALEQSDPANRQQDGLARRETKEGMMVTVNINGQVRQVDVPPDMPLLWVLRDVIGLTGTQDIHWEPFPAFPPSVHLAIVVGQPSEPGPYLIRVKVPSGVKLMPHRHREDRIYTVMSGVFY
jgi:hypothetical protein